MMELHPGAYAAIASICTTLINAAGVYAFRKLIFQRKMTKEDRENIAVSYAALLDSQQKRIDGLIVAQADHQAAYLRDMRQQREECAQELQEVKEATTREIKQIRQSAEREAALMNNRINRLIEQHEKDIGQLRESHRLDIERRDKEHARCEQNYAEVLLELRSYQLKHNVIHHGLPGSPPQ